MEKIGNQKIWSYFDSNPKVRAAANLSIRAAAGHRVSTYFELAKKVAELQFLNRDHVLLFRGQPADYRTTKGNSLLKATVFRLANGRIPTARILTKRFETLKLAELALVERYEHEAFIGRDRLKRQRILRWAILQHYEVCRTPLLDVTHSLRIAASFASIGSVDEAFVFVLGVPNLSGAVTASSEANLQIVRLSSACPPEAVRPHLQEGYLLGEYPEIADFEQNAHYSHYEMDFGRRLIAKFRFNPVTFWKSPNFPRATDEALYPKDHRDPLLSVAQDLKTTLPSDRVTNEKAVHRIAMGKTAPNGGRLCVFVLIPPFLLSRSPILAQFGKVHGGVEWDLRPFAYRRLSIGEGPASNGRIKRLKRRDSATAIGDDDRTPTGGETNPAPGLEVQFADRDRLHVQIVTHLSEPERFSPL